MAMQPFSKRQGLKSQEKEITIRHEAPQGLREFIIQTVIALGHEPNFIRDIICRVLRKIPNRDNWSPYPNIFNETVELITECEWFYVYDIIEAFYKALNSKERQSFQEEVNDFFLLNGIGWKLENGTIEVRGDENFELELTNAISILHEAKLHTAKTEIKEALSDLSRRPEADVTGAIQHSLACLECVAREITGTKMTLGDLIKKHSEIIPKPLDQAISKIYGFASEQGRHLQEGRQPNYDEAELTVGLSAVLSTYLSKKIIRENNYENDY
jgi:hypothetical protein